MLSLKRIIKRRTMVTFKSLKRNSTGRAYTNLSYFHKVGTESLRPLTVGNVIEITANKYPDREAVVSIQQKQRVTYREILRQADKLAAGLKILGLEKGDRIGLLAPNTVEWVVSKIASARAGFVLVPINSAYQANEVVYCINKVGVKGLICAHRTKTTNFYDILTKTSGIFQHAKSENMPSLKTIIMISEETPNDVYNYNEIMKLADENSVKNIQESQHLIQPDDAFTIQFTSGTTGKPKATVLSHFQVINNSYYVGKRNELDQKQHRICVQIPFFHAFGLIVTLAAAFNFGATLIVPSSTYNAEDNLCAIMNEKCTSVYGTPTMYVDLINLQMQKQLNINPEIVFSGGSPCSPELFRQIKENLKVTKVKSGYGLTEATSAIFHSLPMEEGEERSTATVGQVSDHLEVKIVDSFDNIVPFGTPGELCVRGYSTMTGYWEDEANTREILGADGWLKTGDQLILQEDGYGRIVGRLKDMIIRGGQNIFPKEIEDVLNTHPDIMESHVVGLPHKRLGEEVCACVKLKKGTQLKQQDLEDFCKRRMARFKIPSKLKVVEAFPLTGSGKIQKYLLKELFQK